MTVSIWRSASKTPTVFGIPCVAFVPMFGWLLYSRVWTFVLGITIIVVFAILAKLGLTFPVLWGKFLHLIRGSTIYARPWWYRNRFADDPRTRRF